MAAKEITEIIKDFASDVVRYVSGTKQVDKANDFVRVFGDVSEAIGESDEVTITDKAGKPFEVNGKSFDYLVDYFENLLMEISVAEINLEKQASTFAQMIEWKTWTMH
jgi:hypothetical protein